ncbi:MAG: FIST C-terminal domain-containing protein [Candidatus Omnitrophica bacterium]|nr:FIST C-terminal domain-containing protein [Candidatus Omnitrophota bacterium]
MLNETAVAAYWPGKFDEAALQSWAEELRARLAASRIALGLVYMSPRFFPHAQTVLEILRVHAQIPLLLGSSSTGLIFGDQEEEDSSGLVLGLYTLPGAQLLACHFTQSQLEESNGPSYWHAETGVLPGQCNGWLAFVDPFHLNTEGWLNAWNQAYPGCPILGGLASGDPSEQRTQLYLNGEVYETGGVGVAFSGEIQLAHVIAQGCIPIGETWTITKADRNLIYEIGNRPAYKVLADTYNSLSIEDQKKTRGNLFIGLVVNEYLEEFRQGDFLIRNLLGADARSGVLAVGAFPRQGQTIQFQRRDAAAATLELTALLKETGAGLSGATLQGGCLCCCNGRGQRLFGMPHHDASLVQRTLAVPGLVGLFCNGEIGPVGKQNFLHGYTASLALFVKPSAA